MRPAPDAGAVLCAVAVVAGALVGERLGPGDGVAAAGGAAVAAALAAGARAAGPAGRGPGLAVMAGTLAVTALAVVSVALMQRALDGLEGPVAVLGRDGAEAVVVADLVEDPRRRPGTVRAAARIRSMTPAAGRDGSLVLLDARGGAAGRVRLLSAGDAVVVSGRFRALHDGERYLRWRHLAAAFDAVDLHAAGPPRSPVLRLANALRSTVLRGGDPLPEPERALTAGFLVGDDRDLPPDVAADFRAAGLSHLLVVSGANVALAVALVRPALARFGLTGRLGGGLAVIGVFAAMTRFEPSVLRASAMAGLAMLATYLGRPAAGTRYLALAVTGLVFVDPFLVHSLAFRLSCAASAGILLLARPLGARLRGPAWAREALAVTAAAQVGVAPVALPAFGALPLAALPANLAAAPAAAVLTMWGLGTGLAGGFLAPWAPGAPVLLSAPTGALAGYIAAVARAGALLPGSLSPAGAVAGVLVGGGVVAAAGRWGRQPRASRGSRSEGGRSPGGGRGTATAPGPARSRR